MLYVKGEFVMRLFNPDAQPAVTHIFPPTVEIILTIVIAVIIMSILMIAEIPMFSFKFKNKGFKGNVKQIIQITLTIALVAIFGIGGVALSIIAYILLSIIDASYKNKALNN